MNIYFIPGLAANCKVFDRITLPEGYKRQYIEWLIPSEDESIEAYSRRMAKEINTQEAFILAGYSLGGIIIQEMNKFLKPQKSILISSIKGENEIPPLFRLGHRINFAQYFPVDSVIKNDKIVDFFARTIYGTKPEEASEYISVTDPVYTKWAIKRILEWKPSIVTPNLYHIHGARDHIFPIKYIKHAYIIERGDHLMVLKHYKEISKILADIIIKQ